MICNYPRSKICAVTDLAPPPVGKEWRCIEGDWRTVDKKATEEVETITIKLTEQKKRRALTFIAGMLVGYLVWGR